jgi:hypothetical protein
MRCPAFDDTKNFLKSDEVTKRTTFRKGTMRGSYVGLGVVREDGNEEAPMESVGHSVGSKCMRESSGCFQESTRLRHCGERGRIDCGSES